MNQVQQLQILNAKIEQLADLVLFMAQEIVLTRPSLIIGGQPQRTSMLDAYMARRERMAAQAPAQPDATSVS